MAATVIINRLTGAGPTLTDITSTTNRVSQADNASPGTASPVPAAGTLDSNASLSAWCVTRLQCTLAPATLITNLKWYCNNPAMQTDTKFRGETATAYTQAPVTGLTFGGAGELKVANYATLTAPVNLANAGQTGTYTSGAPKSVAGSTSTAVEFGDRMCYQLQVGSTAVPGVLSPVMANTWQYDET
jgi:hypothetical protein